MRYIAFLRAVNVGGRVVRMDQLRRMFESMKFKSVETFIASGNVIFESLSADAAALEDRIERQLEKALGYEVGTCLRSVEELAAVATYEPFGPPQSLRDHSMYVVFLKTRADRTMRAKIAELSGNADAFHAHGRELYWLSRSRISESPAAVPFGKVFGKTGTMRNVTTVRKIAAKYSRP